MDIDRLADEAPQTFFFYDLETSGLNPKSDRIMQFAGIRTDLNFNQIGDPVNLLVKMTDDTLPSPDAIEVTKITPQSTQLDGLSEPEFVSYVQKEIFTPGTIATGYNSIRFDDEFMRYTFYRNFFDPYTWEWQDGRSRWDLLDIVRMTRALRPEGVNWPVTELPTTPVELKPNNRLENLTKENHLPHEHAHDALSDVEALISVTKLLSGKQPDLYSYLFSHRDKRSVSEIIKKPFVYSSGHYSSKNLHTTVAVVIGTIDSTRKLVFDLRYNLEELLEEERNFKPEEKVSKTGKKYKTFFSWSPMVKEISVSKCPAVAPLGVLETPSTEDNNDRFSPTKKGTTGWQKIGLTKEQIQKNYDILRIHPEFIERMMKQYKDKKDSFEKDEDVDGQLYDGFASDKDKKIFQEVRNKNQNELADFNPVFDDQKYSTLLLHYKGRNFSKSLSEAEQKEWEKYRRQRLERQEKNFVAKIEELQKLAQSGKPMKNGKLVDENVLEDLLLWYQSLASSDY